MNKERKAIWTTALRSGKYRQGSTRLRIAGNAGEQDRFCCLGVYCDLFHPEGWGSYNSAINDQSNWAHNNKLGMPSEKICREIDPRYRIDSPLRDPGDLFYVEWLAKLNDDGSDFNAIADWIDNFIPEGP